MSATVVQVDGTLLMVSASGQDFTTLTLPTDIDLATDRYPRMAAFGRYLVVVNTPSRPITVDPLGTVRVLCPRPPSTMLELDDDGGAGSLTGDYKALQTFLLLDANGNTIAESDFGPEMTTAFTASSDTLDAEKINLSPDDVQASRIYRTTASGATYFQWIDVDGNTATQSVADDRSDASLADFAAPTLGSPPDLSHIANWRGRLWGVDRVRYDYVRYAEAGLMYAWPSDNEIAVDPVGGDTIGVSALMPRRDALGVGRLNVLRQVTGTSADDFRCLNLSENVGVLAQETVSVYKDTAYFLWYDGVYQWGPDGIKCVSDGKVRSWFTTSSYFNTALLSSAFAFVDPLRNRYILFLAAAGSSTIDRWVEYDLIEKKWWGPHRTSEFSPKCAFNTYDSNNRPLPLIGGLAGFLYKSQTTATDGTAEGIAIRLMTKFHDQKTPNIMKHWGQLSVLGRAQASTKGTIGITPYVGDTDAAAKLPFYYKMLEARQTKERLGVGALCKLLLTHSTAGQPVELYGYEVQDIFECGDR